ncbi:hypothetical protein K466DRAFT_596689 [Polyporus arcularius HHB13444]|uniref:F-box domain-containing protein n=1 Tax=Polyporus arcularius HHB13444 TaxID=1314778 RepID=A0A5C3PML9_9APHY|nr:hypothetical protein K466DRAFT_596689 [Polyporus arcularius HHB13444]
MPSLVSHLLPLELIHSIVFEAWVTIESSQEWRSRWDFFRDVSMVSKTWRSVMTDVALRLVTIGTRRDFEAYKRIIRQEFGVDPNFTDVERVHPSADKYFERSDLHITLTDWASTINVFAFSCDYTRIPHYIPKARFIDVTIRELPTNDRHTLPFRPLFQCLSQYRATRRMSLRWTYTHINRFIVPTGRVRGVTYLRLVEYPRCNCHNFRIVLPGTGPEAGPNAGPPLYFPVGSHRLDCFSHYLPTLFPDLRHLHLETPYLLKRLKLPPSVALLTLEAPPVHYLPSVGYYSSLMSWNIISAVSAGLLRRTENDAPRKRIVVKCGPNEPVGWRQAVSACESRDVDLESRHVYKVQHSEPLPRATKRDWA